MRAALVLSVLVAAPAAAQPELPATGSELFRGLLHRAGFVPAVDPGDTPQVVVVFNSPAIRPAWLSAVAQRTLAAGGSVLVTSDVCYDLPALLPGRPSLALQGGQVPPGPTRRLDGRWSVETVSLRPAGAKNGPVLPADVVVAAPGWRLDLDNPRSRWAAGVFAVQGRGLPFGAAVADTSRAVVLASGSVFSNRLLAGTFADGSDTGNLEFAVNVVRWLKPAGDGAVSCLFIENGRPVDRFDAVDYTAALLPPLPAPAPPPLSAFLTPEAQAKLTDAGNEAFDRVQTDDRFGEALAGRLTFPRVMQWALGVLALMGAVALVRRARAARAPADPPTPAGVERPAGLFAQRREELLRGGDHTAAVREYLAELFRTYGLPLDEYRHPKRMPRVQADRETRRQIATLWEAAYGPAPVSYSRWKELEPMIEAVSAAGAAGRWRFAEGRA